MVFPFRKKPSSESLKQDAMKDFESALEKAQDKSRPARQYCLRIALHSRSCIDKIFVEAARKTELYDQETIAAISAGARLPEKPEPSCHQLIKVGEGYIYTYVPERYAVPVFNLGAAYQTMKIDRRTAIDRCQNIANALYEELGLSQSFDVLQFLREEEAEAAHDQDEGASGA